MRTTVNLAITLSLLSMVAFSASPTVEENPMSPLGIRTVIPDEKAKHSLPLYLEAPSTNEVLRCVKKQGGCLVVIPQSGGAVLRKYVKPKFSKTQFVFEDQPLSSNSQAEEAWQGYQWLRDILLSAKCFEMDYGVEITEWAGDKYQTLTNAVKSLARAYNGERIDNKKQYEADFDDVKKMVREKSVAEQGRIGLRAVNAFRAVYAQNYTLPDEETKAILEALDAIRTKGSNGAPDAVKALATRQKAYADAVLAAVRKEREARIAVLAESHVPFEQLFTSSEIAKNPLIGFPDEINEKAEMAIASVDERIAAAQVELAEGRKRYESATAQMANLDNSKFGEERVYGPGNKEKVFAILGKCDASQRFLTATELAKANSIFAQAEDRKKELEQLDGEVMTWIERSERQYAMLTGAPKAIGEELLQYGVLPEAYPNLTNLSLFANDESRQILAGIAKAKNDPTVFGIEERTRIDNLFTIPNERLNRVRAVMAWVNETNGRLSKLMDSGFDMRMVFANGEDKKIREKIDQALSNPLNWEQSEMDTANSFFKAPSIVVAIGQNSRKWSAAAKKDRDKLHSDLESVESLMKEISRLEKTTGTPAPAKLEETMETMKELVAQQSLFITNWMAQCHNPLVIMTKEREVAEKALMSMRSSIDSIRQIAILAIDDMKRHDPEYCIDHDLEMNDHAFAEVVRAVNYSSDTGNEIYDEMKNKEEHARFMNKRIKVRGQVAKVELTAFTREVKLIIRRRGGSISARFDGMSREQAAQIAIGTTFLISGKVSDRPVTSSIALDYCRIEE